MPKNLLERIAVWYRESGESKILTIQEYSSRIFFSQEKSSDRERKICSSEWFHKNAKFHKNLFKNQFTIYQYGLIFFLFSSLSKQIQCGQKKIFHF